MKHKFNIIKKLSELYDYIFAIDPTFNICDIIDEWVDDYPNYLDREAKKTIIRNERNNK